ncbi:hypothetical protein ACFL59_09825 [Planctomycetota bacterium]
MKKSVITLVAAFLLGVGAASLFWTQTGMVDAQEQVQPETDPGRYQLASCADQDQAYTFRLDTVSGDTWRLTRRYDTKTERQVYQWRLIGQ